MDTFESLGLQSSEDFVVVLGQSAFYEGYLGSAAPESAPDLLSALAAKDLVRVDELAAGLTARSPRLRGRYPGSSVPQKTAPCWRGRTVCGWRGCDGACEPA